MDKKENLNQENGSGRRRVRKRENFFFLKMEEGDKEWKT